MSYCFPEQPLYAVTIGLTTLTMSLFLAAAIDYYQWVAFGTGGTAPNFQGYLKMTKFRILRFLSRDNLKDPSKISREGPSYLVGQLRQRTRPAPKIIGRTLPQRQFPAHLGEAIYRRLHSLPEKYATKYHQILELDKSITEGRTTDAIYAKRNSSATASDKRHRAYDKILGDEIAHVHPAENSLHVWLTQADARKVLEAGWGERFPLASLGMVDNGWTFIYAPQTMDDVDIIEEIVKAGIGHLTGMKID